MYVRIIVFGPSQLRLTWLMPTLSSSFLLNCSASRRLTFTQQSPSVPLGAPTLGRPWVWLLAQMKVKERKGWRDVRGKGRKEVGKKINVYDSSETSDQPHWIKVHMLSQRSVVSISNNCACQWMTLRMLEVPSTIKQNKMWALSLRH